MMQPYVDHLKTGNAEARTYDTWREAFIGFHKGLLQFPPGVLLWLGLLMTLNAVIPIFFLPRVGAVASIGTFIISFALMIVITKQSGFTRLLGLGHFLWFPLIAFLWYRLGPLDSGSGYVLWVIALTACNSISLVIDVVDVIRYLRGDRGELVGGS